ncbi:unnamed protein product [Sphagnum tenellum]
MTPVAAAVLPLKEAAIERAEQESKAWVARAYADLEAVGWNLDKIVPYPRSSDPAFKSKLIRRSMYDAVTTWTQPTRRPGEPNIVRADERKAAQFVQISKEDASAHYDSFVAKLEDKIGEIVNEMKSEQPIIPESYADLVQQMIDTNSGTVIDGRPPRPLFIGRIKRPKIEQYRENSN